MKNCGVNSPKLIRLKVLINLHLAEQITNASTEFAIDKCNRLFTFNIYEKC